MPVTDTLGRLIGFPTVSNRPITELAAYVAERHEGQGFRVELFEDPSDATKVNVVASAGPADVEGGLMLSGHMDVVPTEGQPWTSDPFVLTERGDRLLGRGTSDMKGFIAATIEALDRMDVRGLSQPLVLVWTHDEEVGCVGAQKLVPRLRGRPLPKQCLIGEPTDFQIFRMHPGHVAVRVETRGVSAHSSKPDLGRNALKSMATLIGRLNELEEELKTEQALHDFLDRPYTTFNLAQIAGGSAINLVPDRVTLDLGYRPLPGDDPMAVFRRIEDRMKDLDASASVLRMTRAMLTPDGTPLQHLCAAHAVHDRPLAASFATDGGALADLGIESIIFGPGSIDVAHAPDEYVETDALHRAVDVVEAMVRDVCA